MSDKNFRNMMVNAGHLVVGILIIVVIVLILQAVLGYVQIKTTPPGWDIIRPPGEVSTLFIDNDSLWTGGKEGIILITRSRIPLPAGAPPVSYVRQIIAPAPGIPFTRVLSLAERNNSNIVVGTETDVFVNEGNGRRSLRASGMPEIVSADVLLATQSGDLWVGCGVPMRGALFRLNGTSWQHYTVSDGLPHPAVCALTETDDGTIWVATGYSRKGGAARYSHGTWTNLTRADGLAGESTRSVFLDSRGRIWIGSEYDGIAVRDTSTWKILTEKDGLAGNEVKTMVQDNAGVYWLGTNGGLSRIAPDVEIG